MAVLILLPLAAVAQVPQPAQSGAGEASPVAKPEIDGLRLPGSIAIDAAPDDEAIDARLESILNATGWFESTDITVTSGVVFLRGTADAEVHKEWAGNLAGRTESVVAVVNDLDVAKGSPWDLSPALEQIRDLAARMFRALPLVLVGAMLLLATWLVARVVLAAATRLLGTRISSDLLRDVLARTVAALFFVLGVYVVLQISGLTGLAVTIIGGTGLLGLAIGFAFRDIAENFLASILISMQRPFAMGDLIEVNGREGFVQRVNTRATVLMTHEGNHVQVPNAIIYKNAITNFTANPRGREEFVVGIGYDDSIADAQNTAFDVLRSHPAVLADPEPLVLVEQLGASTVKLRILFWVNIADYSRLKVRSAIIRLTKSAFEARGISMPDEAREVIFPKGVPVITADSGGGTARRAEVARDTSIAHRAEGDLATEAPDLQRQAQAARLPEGGKNLI